MAKTGAPPKRRSTKGKPPAADAAPDNLTRPDYSGETKNLNFTVPVEFWREFKTYAIGQGKSMVQVLFEAFELHKKQNQ